MNTVSKVTDRETGIFLEFNPEIPVKDAMDLLGAAVKKATAQPPQPPTEMASLREIKQRLAAIEQEQVAASVQLGEILARQDQDREAISSWISRIETAQSALYSQGDVLAQKLEALMKRPTEPAIEEITAQQTINGKLVIFTATKIYHFKAKLQPKPRGKRK